MDLALYIKTEPGWSILLPVNLTDTIHNAKARLQARLQDGTGHSINIKHFAFALDEKILKDHRTVADYNLEDTDRLQLMIWVPDYSKVGCKRMRILKAMRRNAEEDDSDY